MEISSLDMRVKSLEDGLDRLRQAYEQYFAGLSKIPPLPQHEDWKKEMRGLNPADLTSSSLKFRFVNMKQRAAQLENYWQRVCKQIEEGSHRRDQFNLKKQTQSEEVSTASALKGLTSKETKALESLYEKIVSAKTKSKAVDKEKFFEKMKTQIQVFKQKNPSAKMQFRVGKDANGQTSIKISKK